MGEHFDRLNERLATVHNLSRAGAVLGWDHRTYMPPGGARARAEQMATIARLAHEMFIADETGELLDRAAPEVESLSRDSFEASLVRVARRDYEQARRIPAELVARTRRHSGLAEAVWADARQKNDFPLFQPYLEESTQLSRERAEHLGYEEDLYDALLDQYEPGMKTAQVREIFSGLREELVALVTAVRESGIEIDDSFLHQPFDEADQERFGVSVVTRFGYDFSRGRQDRTVHPFANAFSRDDVRITTRFDPNFLNMALFGTLHESGHAMYEQGVGEELEGTLLARGASLGVHESQSRLWENVVGRSRPFWEHFYPRLQETFPQIADVPLDRFYAAVNKVQPSLIRVEADEVTYCLHIMLRFEMEIELLSGAIPSAEAPDVWRDRMQSYLGVVPPNDTLGVLQDVHWSSGIMGYFPTYALGSILSVQLYDTAVSQRPEIPDAIGRGEFAPLHDWLEQNLYRHGRKYEPNELIERATGKPLTTEPYVAYLKRKFGELYGIQV